MESPFEPSVAFAVRDHGTPDDLHPEERTCLSPRAVPKRVRDFTFGRLAAADCLARLGHAPMPIRQGTDRAPVWPTGLVGSITHSGGVAIAAVGRASEWLGLGVDYEHVAGVRRVEIAERIADASERAWIGSDRRRLAAVFSAKEAIFKAIYPRYGRWFGFEAVSLTRTRSGFDARLMVDLDRPAGSVVRVGVRATDEAVLTWVSLPAR